MDIGLYGLAVMGQNFALNMASKGFQVSVCNRSPSKVETTVQRAKVEGVFIILTLFNQIILVFSCRVYQLVVIVMLLNL